MTTTVSATLPADPRNVGRARDVVRRALLDSGAEQLTDVSALVISELVTNAFVHTGSGVQLLVSATSGSIRVEVEDRGDGFPVRRNYAQTAGTGRGLQLVDELTTRWGVDERAEGKAVWFEIGAPDADERSPRGRQEPMRQQGGVRSADTVQVTLRHVPLLLHGAWQEHAATLLREFLLFALEEDDEVLVRHAQASEAMSLLSEQLPMPALADAPDALMARAIEPLVSADELVLRVPTTSVLHFAALDDLLGQAIAAARAGHFLSPPTQPEIEEMRQWLCREVLRQAGGATTATPWVARTDVRATLADQAALTTRYAELAKTEEPLIATDEGSIIVAASATALALLGYDRAEQLVGRRVIVVVPPRFHQAHIAGTTLHATNGRSTLLGVPITVPMTRADGSEVLVDLEVRPLRLDEGHRVFVAHFHAV